MGVFDVTKLKVLDGKVYEECNNDEHKYRVILSSDDYDYVEDESLISRLDQEDYL